jgi:hypothetical protein
MENVIEVLSAKRAELAAAETDYEQALLKAHMGKRAGSALSDAHQKVRELQAQVAELEKALPDFHI